MKDDKLLRFLIIILLLTNCILLFDKVADKFIPPLHAQSRYNEIGTYHLIFNPVDGKGYIYNSIYGTYTLQQKIKLHPVNTVK